jgi:hypothetical protein
MRFGVPQKSHERRDPAENRRGAKRFIDTPREGGAKKVRECRGECDGTAVGSRLMRGLGHRTDNRIKHAPECPLQAKANVPSGVGMRSSGQVWNLPRCACAGEERHKARQTGDAERILLGQTLARELSMERPGNPVPASGSSSGEPDQSAALHTEERVGPPTVAGLADALALSLKQVCDDRRSRCRGPGAPPRSSPVTAHRVRIQRAVPAARVPHAARGSKSMANLHWSQ